MEIAASAAICGPVASATCSSEELTSNAIEVFEGPEKILEMEFVRQGEHANMRSISRESWDKILSFAQCMILNKTSNDHFDAYVLSESSLFVYEKKVFLKTCGTTTLLRCLPLLLETAEAAEMELEWMCYSRKNYQFPEEQSFPHKSFSHELEYAKKCNGPRGQPLRGGAYVLGDLLGDHWYVFCADYSGTLKSAERNVNIMMYGLEPDVCQHFYRRKDLSLREDSERATNNTGIRRLCPKSAVIDDYQFEPCGYSMNALDGKYFYTVHITPEEAFSYASFETNFKCDNYDELVKNVLAVFRPSRFVVTLFGDDEVIHRIKQCPTNLSLKDFKPCQFKRVSQTVITFHDDHACRMAVYQKPERREACSNYPRLTSSANKNPTVRSDTDASSAPSTATAES